MRWRNTKLKLGMLRATNMELLEGTASGTAKAFCRLLGVYVRSGVGALFPSVGL